MTESRVFGYTINSPEEEKSKKKIETFSPPNFDDGAVVVGAGGSYGTFYDIEGTAKNEGELVTKYRKMALESEMDIALQHIINEIISEEENKIPIEINLEEVELPDNIKKKIKDEFDELLKMLRFKSKGYELIKKWYIDGRLYFHLIIDKEKPQDGIKEIRYIDPRRIRKIREEIKNRDNQTNVLSSFTKSYKEYFIYNPKGVFGSHAQGIKIAKDAISYITSGLLDENNKMVLSNLHKAIKPLNQLRMLEDATVIYMLSRAPERRIFYIDVGRLPKPKAEEYVRDMMTRHKNKLIYDASTGNIRDDRKFLTMTEDFWLPRREGGRGTEITTLPAGQGIGSDEMLPYFRQKLYRSLDIPITRLESDQAFNFGRPSEITRDELNFNKKIIRLRKRFSTLFDNIMEIQLALKSIMTREEWNDIEQDVTYDFLKDNHFTEMKDAEITRERIGLLTEVDPYKGVYFSKRWIQENILRMSEEEIDDMEKEIDEEEKDGEYDQMSPGQGGFPPQDDDEPPPTEEPPPVEPEPNANTKPDNQKTEEFTFKLLDVLKEI